ncbi:MAG: AEC family transporter [Hyphomicrobiaceae bacterium]|nr:AEC family transporter [Hyphomicrobiaceae bacterium]
MLDILQLIAPVFGLIGLGFIAAKSGYLEPGAARVLAAFGYKVAMPALLFRAMATAGATPVSPFMLAATYLTGIAATWIAATLVSVALLRRAPDDAPAIAMGACFSNGVMLGFPVILLALGPEAATPMAFLATCETIFLWLFGTLHMGIARHSGGRAWLAALGSVVWDMATNPLIIALATGLLWRASGLALPAVPARLLELMAGAAIPVSLFALGMALAAYPVRGEGPTVATLCLMKLVAYPALAFWLATEVFQLPRVWAGALVIYVAMPVGANAFIFAQRYDRAVASVSGSVAVSTLLSVVSVTLVLGWLKLQGIVLP